LARAVGARPLARTDADGPVDRGGRVGAVALAGLVVTVGRTERATCSGQRLVSAIQTKS